MRLENTPDSTRGSSQDGRGRHLACWYDQTPVVRKEASYFLFDGIARLADRPLPGADGDALS